MYKRQIVAVTQVAVDNGLMAARISSVLVAAGAVTVLLFPLLAELVRAGTTTETKEKKETTTR